VSSLDAVLARDRLVDLTQPLGPATVLWPGSAPFEAVIECDYDTYDSYSRELRLPEHSGTHIDAPAHFAHDGLTTDQIPIDALVRPAVKLDVRDRVGDNPRYELDAAAVEALEAADGRIPPGSVVLVHTGWDARHADPAAYAGDDGLAFPGLARGAARLLVDRRVAGIGIDTLGVDPGHAEGFPVHRITLPAGLWHLEGLVNLERLPARGAWIVVAALPVVAGSGAPARVLAVLPADA
jgi:kynurenine formamidase